MQPDCAPHKKKRVLFENKSAPQFAFSRDVARKLTRKARARVRKKVLAKGFEPPKDSLAMRKVKLALQRKLQECPDSRSCGTTGILQWLSRPLLSGFTMSGYFFAIMHVGSFTAKET